ncbi:MAG: patatin-like phospholipase family protein [Dehalococcoidia bacterium]
MSEPLLALEQTPLFQGLTADEFAYLQERLAEVSLEPGAHLLEMGEEAPGLYVMRSGTTGVVVHGADGRDVEVASLGAGECFGEIALLSGEPCSATVLARTPATAWFIGRQEFADLIDKCPGLWRNLAGVLSQRLIRTTRRLAQVSAENLVVLVLACPAAEEASLACTLAVSLAEQSGQRVLLVDGRRSPNEPLAGDSGMEELPSLAALIEQRSLLIQHESQNGHGRLPRTARLSDQGETPLSDEQCLGVFELLAPFYDHILLALPGLEGEPRHSVMRNARSVMALVSEDEAAGAAGWLARLSSKDNRTLGVTLLSGAAPSADLLQRLEERLELPIIALHREDVGQPGANRAGIDRVARHLGRMTVGLALGAGAAKGLAHVGVLRVLLAHGVPIDYIAGSSIGAVVGALFAGGFNPDQIEETITGADRKIVRWTLPLTALWSDGGLRKLLSGPGPTTQFHELRTPFAAVATDLISGREVVLRDGLVWRAVQASVSIPGMFPPTQISGRFLVDGGVITPVPTQAARDLGADRVIAVDLSSPGLRPDAPARMSVPMEKERGGHSPRFVEVLWRATEIMQTEMTAKTAGTADVTIAPTVGRSRFSDFTRRPKEFVKAGEEAAEAALSEIAAFVPALKTVEGVKTA